MKQNKEFRGRAGASGPDNPVRKAVRLKPAKKSGKERHELFGKLHGDDEPETYVRRESILDYFDADE